MWHRPEAEGSGGDDFRICHLLWWRCARVMEPKLFKLVLATRNKLRIATKPTVQVVKTWLWLWHPWLGWTFFPIQLGVCGQLGVCAAKSVVWVKRKDIESVTTAQGCQAHEAAVERICRSDIARIRIVQVNGCSHIWSMYDNKSIHIGLRTNANVQTPIPLVDGSWLSWGKWSRCKTICLFVFCLINSSVDYRSSFQM